MRYRTLGRSGLQVSELCLGMMSYGDPSWQKWVLPQEQGEHHVRRALEAGINFFDTADFYSYGASEEILGASIEKLTSRQRVAISTKVGLPMDDATINRGLSRKHVFDAVEQSLRRLRTDYIDLYMYHQEDPLTPVEETMDAMADLVKAGKVLYVGMSNMPTWKAAKGAMHGRITRGVPLTALQVQYNLCYREDEREALPFCSDEQIGVMVYSPLARGWLAGNRLPQAGVGERDALRAASDAKAHSLYGSDGDAAVLRDLLELAKRRGVPPARMAMAWVLSKQGVTTMICGILEDSHLDEASAACELSLSDEEIQFLERSYVPQPLKDTGLKAVLGRA